MSSDIKEEGEVTGGVESTRTSIQASKQKTEAVKRQQEEDRNGNRVQLLQIPPDPHFSAENSQLNPLQTPHLPALKKMLNNSGLTRVLLSCRMFPAPAAMWDFSGRNTAAGIEGGEVGVTPSHALVCGAERRRARGSVVGNRAVFQAG